MFKIFIQIIIILLFSQTVYAQLSTHLENMQMPRNTDATMGQTQLQYHQTETYPVGNVIDAEVYLIGPSDVLSIQIFPEMIPMITVVNSENMISHPRLGNISVLGLTLQQVRDTLTFIANQRRYGATVTVSLVQARRVFVEIRGNVTSPGTYVLPATYSISTAIRYANNPQISAGLSSDEQSAISSLQEARKEREKIFSEAGVAENAVFSTRNIRLIRSNGNALIVDIERANATRNAAFDPFIAEGDEIIVPFEEETDFPVISISGAVIRPASVVLKQGDSLSHLLRMGYGFTENADLENVVLFNKNGSQKLTVDTVGNLLSENIRLNSTSIIVVGTKPTELKQSNIGMVSVRGEVRNPNIYVIEKGKTKLKDVIEMAGGFTETAHLPLATVGRRDNSQNERVSQRRRYSEYFKGSNMTEQDTLRFMMTINMKFPTVSCDFVSVFSENSEEYNIILRDGDVINIPSKPNRVFVFGQINKPGFVDFEEGQSMEWYIMKAGGYASGAAKKRSRIIRGNNRVYVNGFEKEVFVNDGDEIFVPSPRDVPPEMELQRWATYMGMAGVVLSVIGIFWGIYRDNKYLRNLNN